MPDGFWKPPATEKPFMVTVTAGANTNDLEGLEGQTVGAVRAAFGGVFNISAGSAAKINGRSASDSTVLRSGDDLVFAAPTASKG